MQTLFFSFSFLDSHDSNAFRSNPPASSLLQLPSTVSTAKESGLKPQAPFPVSASPLPIQSQSQGISADVSSNESSDNEAASTFDALPSRRSWYVIYEGGSKEVTVSNLTPGLSLQFRVRATTSRVFNESSLETAWGPASVIPVNVTMPAVPPMSPPSNLKLLGRPKPNEINLTWNLPSSNGGAPILSYEVCMHALLIALS